MIIYNLRIDTNKYKFSQYSKIIILYPFVQYIFTVE